VSHAVALHLSGSDGFKGALKAILGGAPGEWLTPALPYSVIAENCSGEAIALIGVRFDLTSRTGKKMSVIHLADTLRNPEKTEFAPGSCRFFCAEAEYAAVVARGGAEVSRRARMNLQNLRTMLRVRASVDCIAYCDGRFEGPDTGGAFERFTRQRAAEESLIARIMHGDVTRDELTNELNGSDPARRALAAKFLDALGAAGPDAMLECARLHRLRAALVRIEEQIQG
jgi:hypothetical protein